MKIERTCRINTGFRIQNHDDLGRNAVKAVPVYRVKIVSKNKYRGDGSHESSGS